MRALVLRDFWDLAVEDRPDPVAGPGEVVLRITATGICGSDFHGYSGENGRRRAGQIMGHETVGRIDAVGTGVGLTVGAVATINPVLTAGGIIGVTPEVPAAFAEQLVVPAENVVPLPEEMPEEYGALVEPLSVGYHAALRGGCAGGDRVLVIGGGPIGQACALAAQRLGAQQVMVSELSSGRRALIGDLGLTAIEPGGDIPGGPVDVVIDAVGIGPTLAAAAEAAKPGGRIVLVGMGAPTVELSAYAFSVGERSLVGSYAYTREEFAETAIWVGTAPEQLARLIEGRVDLAGANDAFARLARGEATESKILVFPHGVPTT